MAVAFESFLQFYFFLLPRCYSAMRVKTWNYKLQIALQNLKSVLPYINNTKYRSKVDVRLNGSSDSSLILVYCYFDRFFGTSTLWIDNFLDAWDTILQTLNDYIFGFHCLLSLKTKYTRPGTLKYTKDVSFNYLLYFV